MSKTEQIKAIKLRLDPDKATAETIDGQSRICNWSYNRLLQCAIELRSEFIQTKNQQSATTVYSERGLRNLLPSLKEEHPFLKTVHSSCTKNAALRLSRSIKAHQKSRKGKKRAVRWPRYRSWSSKWFSLEYDEPTKGFKVENDRLILSLGSGMDKKSRSISIPLIGGEALAGKKIRALRVVKELGVFYAVFTVQVELPSLKPIKNAIAFDPNHKNLAYGVDTRGKSIEIASPRWLKTYDRRIDELKRKRDRCKRKAQEICVLDNDGQNTGRSYWKPSRRWEKCNTTLERAYRKRRDPTKTFLFTAANALCARYDCIAVGDYAPQGGGVTTRMRRAMNNRSLIGRFKEVLSWVASKSGKTFLVYEEKGTTRTCYHCGYSNEEGLIPSVRHWQCPSCASENGRDENAAKNGLRKVLWDLSKQGEAKASLVSCSDLVHVNERWAWRVAPSGVVKTLRGCQRRLLAAPGN